MDYEKKIEIPFGAMDSELKGWEYTIPEGMEAEIKDGKIVVKEKESEDEKIRKRLTTLIRLLDSLFFTGDNPSKEQCLAYLEKQKEYANDLSPEQEAYITSERFKQAEKEKDEFTTRQFLQCLTSFDKFREGEHYWLEYVGGDMYVGRSDNVLGEKFHITPRQLFSLFSNKLEEVSESQQDKQKQRVQWPNMSNCKHDCKTCSAKCIYRKEQNEEQKQEWSEEDEVYLQDALWCVKQASKVARGENDMGACWSAERWLKSLRPSRKKNNTTCEKI